MGGYINEFVVPPIDEGGTANGTSYDNTSSGLAATDVQEAIDEVAAAVVGGGTTFTEEEFIPTAGQTAFTLGAAYVGSGLSIAYVNGVGHAEGTHYTIVGTAFTWLDAEFSLDVTDELVVKYQTA